MTDSQNGDPTASATTRTPRTWDFWETIFVSLIAYGAFDVIGRLAYAALVAAYDGPAPSSAILRRLDHTASIIACGPTIAVLWIAVRMAGRELSEYLALNWPSRDELMRALTLVFILWLVEIASKSHRVALVDLNEPFGGAGGLFLFFVGTTITAPIMEEFIFRGFMFRGWSLSFLGPTGAIVLISAIWAALHIHRSPWQHFWIFVSGVAFGYFRWRSHSTWLAVFCHSATNVLTFFVR